MESKKLVIAGDTEVGKTSILSVVAKDQFPNGPIPFENYEILVDVADKKIELVLWDTPGKEDYDMLRTLSYPDTDVIVLCFSIAAPDSLKNITKKWAPEVKHFCPDVPIILVGTKVDLRDDPNVIKALEEQNQKPVEQENGYATAEAIGSAFYMECSALRNVGIREIINTAATLCVKED